MAQVQKQEVRDQIIQSAKIEFHRAGYEGANMRNIASGADITVGNLYRYFESKDELYKEVISKIYILVNSTIERITKMNISMSREIDPSDVQNLKDDKEHNYIRMIVDEIVSLFSEDRIRLLILLKDERGNQTFDMKYSFVEWVHLALKRKLSTCNISMYLTYAFIEGLIRIAEDIDDDKELSDRLEAYIQFYFMRE
ncbi:TetR/AcrR family transcriptional regulator [Fusibacter ferrireducens]|uniref:TetR/AcrR family transcriptional regulator n=1 Tax=Fusibacter ferrireducens TaxID=2785058 RepID=A0ABR9ZTB8_9FIRM|nr:TetR/AcrR family transcriptional regulator [Fusibacter ferrireducens]MBF4692839.1 TetR/AcrR family transcriptional regulator [Fusibacter ferrireducens]